jgi:hypothetical protein
MEAIVHVPRPLSPFFPTLRIEHGHGSSVLQQSDSSGRAAAAPAAGLAAGSAIRMGPQLDLPNGSGEAALVDFWELQSAGMPAVICRRQLKESHRWMPALGGRLCKWVGRKASPLRRHDSGRTVSRPCFPCSSGCRPLGQSHGDGTHVGLTMKQRDHSVVRQRAIPRISIAVQFNAVRSPKGCMSVAVSTNPEQPTPGQNTLVMPHCTLPSRLAVIFMVGQGPASVAVDRVEDPRPLRTRIVYKDSQFVNERNTHSSSHLSIDP